MLPECRTEGDPFEVPVFTIDKGDIEDFLDELKGFHGEFRECFLRSEPRENFYRYMVGQFSELERKSIEPIALAVEDGAVRSMQRAISDAPWDEKKMKSKYRYLLAEDMGDPRGVLIFDETGYLKKGSDSAGVARQYCGAIGKVENCQVGVFTAYASPRGYALAEKRLFVPQKWFSEEYALRRKKCKVPEDLQFKSKPELAAEMYREIHNEGILPFKYIVADSLYGNSPDFMEAVTGSVGKTYFVSIPSDTKVWLERPVTRVKEYTYRGKKRRKVVVEKTENKPIPVSALGKSINRYFWYRRKVSEGTKGPIEYEFTKRRVTLSREGLPSKSVWLIIKRTIGSKPTYDYFISNAPLSARLKLFVWLSGIRWAIEQCFEEAKTELGMDQYEVRKYPGWNHHVLTCMLGHFFLWHLKIRLGKKSTSHYAVAA